MTETEWLAGHDPAEMLQALVYIPRPSVCVTPGVGGLWFTERKLHLLTLACMRAEIVGRPNGTDALEAFERAADAEHPRPALLEASLRFPGHCRFDWPDYNLAKSTVRETGQHGCRLIRDIFGNPFRPTSFFPEWRTDAALTLARQMYELREFGAMPILADALQDGGCDNGDILDHCRGPGPHVRGCWALDLVLGNE